MLIRLLSSFLRPYRTALLLVVALQLAGTMASLYLPSLNADIIDHGIARGDTGYILRTGGWMLLVTLIQVLCSIAAVYHGSRIAMGFGRDVRGAMFHRVGEFSAREVNRFGAPSLITRNTNDVQQVQMLVLMTCTMLVAAPIMCVGGVVMALREDVGLSWLMAVCVPVLVAGDRRGDRADGAAVPGHADPHRRGQPDPARADHRHPGGAGVRPGAAGDPAVRGRERRADRRRHPGRPAAGADLPDRHAGAERVQRGRALVRRRAGGRRAPCRSAR